MSIAKSTRRMPLGTMEKIMVAAGATRVSEGAKKELKRVLEEYASNIAKQATLYARHAKRKTIKSEDLRLAIKK